APGHPVAQRGHVRVAVDDELLAAVRVVRVRRPRRFARADDAALLVDPDAAGNVDALECGADGMLRVDERRERRLCRVVPLARGGFTAGVLRGRDDLEVLIFQLSVDILPAWQIEAASSPGCPRDQQDFLSAEVL